MVIYQFKISLLIHPKKVNLTLNIPKSHMIIYKQYEVKANNILPSNKMTMNKKFNNLFNNIKTIKAINKHLN